MPKALTQFFSQIEIIIQLLKKQQSAKRSELLVLEFERGKMMGFLNGLSFALLHFTRPSVCGLW